MKLISFVIPVYEEKEGIAHFLKNELIPEIEKVANYKKEIVIVNDGSTDGTLEIVQALIRQNDTNIKMRLVSFSRNFGKEIALAAGIHAARGDAVISIDADGQQPVNKIPEFIKKWEEGYQIVSGIRDHYTKHGLIARAGSKLFYHILKKMGNNHIKPGSTDYRLLDRVVVDEYNKLTEHNRINRGLIDWIGFKNADIYYVYGSRYAGKTNYNFDKLFRLAINSFVSISVTPLLIFAYIGAFITFLGLALGIFCIVNQYILNDPLHLYWGGAVQMSIFITFLIGLLMVSQSVTALYISQIHAETQSRPLYIIDHENSIDIDEKKA